MSERQGKYEVLVAELNTLKNNIVGMLFNERTKSLVLIIDDEGYLSDTNLDDLESLEAHVSKVFMSMSAKMVDQLQGYLVEKFDAVKNMLWERNISIYVSLKSDVSDETKNDIMDLMFEGYVPLEFISPIEGTKDLGFEQYKPSFFWHSRDPLEQPETPLDSPDIDKLLLTPHTAIQNDPARKAYRARLDYIDLITNKRTRKQIQKFIIDVDSLRLSKQSLKNTELLLEWFDEQGEIEW